MWRRCIVGMVLVLLFAGCAVTKVQINLAHKDVEVQVEMKQGVVMRFEVHLKELKSSKFVVYYQNLDFPLLQKDGDEFGVAFDSLAEAREWCDWAENNGYKIKKVMMEVI